MEVTATTAQKKQRNINGNSRKDTRIAFLTSYDKATPHLHHFYYKQSQFLLCNSPKKCYL